MMKTCISRVLFAVAVLMCALVSISVSAAADENVSLDIQITSEIRMDAAIASVWPGGEPRYNWWTIGRCDAVICGMAYKDITIETLTEKIYIFYGSKLDRIYGEYEVGFKKQDDLCEVGDCLADSFVISANNGKTKLLEIPVQIKLYPANTFVKTLDNVSITSDFVIDELSGFYDKDTKKRTYEIYTARFDAKIGDTSYTDTTLDAFCSRLESLYPKVKYRLATLAKDERRELKKPGDRIQQHLLIYNDDTVILSTYVYVTVAETCVESVKAEPVCYVTAKTVCPNVKFTILHKDGTSKTYDCSDPIWFDRFTLELDQESFPTEVGEYTKYATVMGTFKVSIPVSVIVSPITLSEIVVDAVYGVQMWDDITDTNWLYYDWEKYGTFSMTIDEETYTNLTIWGNDMKQALAEHGFDHGILDGVVQEPYDPWEIEEAFYVNVVIFADNGYDNGYFQVKTNVVLKESTAPVVIEDTATVPDKGLEMEQDGNFTIDLTKQDGAEENPVKNVVLTSEAVDKFSESEAKVEIVLPGASVSFDSNAVKAIQTKANGRSVKLLVDTVEQDRLNQAQQESLQEETVHICMTLELQGKSSLISDFDDGVVQVNIPFEVPTGKNGEDFQVYYLAEDGSKTAMPTSYADGRLTFQTTHFSAYIVAERTAAPNSHAEPSTMFICIGGIAVMVLGIGMVAWRKMRRSH